MFITEFVNSYLLNGENLAAFVTVLSVLFIVWQYIKGVLERREQILISLEMQLKTSGPWASADNDGYVGEPDERKKLEFTDPYKAVLGIENTALKMVMIQPGIVDFSEKLHENLASYNQHISRITDLNNFRNRIVAGDPVGRSIIVEKLEQENKKFPEERMFTSFLNRFDEKNPLEARAKNLAKFICNQFIVLHYIVIGNRASDGLKATYHILAEEIKGARERLGYFKFRWNMMVFLFTIPMLLSCMSYVGMKFSDCWLVATVAAIITAAISYYILKRPVITSQPFKK